MKKVAQTARKQQSNVIPFPTKEPPQINLHDLVFLDVDAEMLLLCGENGDYTITDQDRTVIWTLRRAA